MPPPLNIALIATGIGYESGAIPFRARLEVEELVQRGHNVIAIGMHTSKEKIALPCQYYEVTPSVMPRPLASISQWISFERKVSKVILKANREQAIDRVVNYEQLYGIRQKLCQKKLNAAWIHQIHRTIWETRDSGANVFNPIHSRLLSMGSLSELTNADSIITLHNAMSQEVRKHCPQAIQPIEIGNGVSCPPLNTRVFPSTQNDQKTILFVGRLSTEKGISVLINAMSKLKGTGYQLKLIGGNPPEVSHYRSIVQSHDLEAQIEFLGNQTQDIVFEHMLSAEALVLPSFSEGMPFVILEAMAHGLPVIASDIPGNRILLKDSTGVLVTPKDEDALADAIKDLLETPEVQKRLSKKGRIRAQEQEWSKVVKQVADLYETTLPAQ